MKIDKLSIIIPAYNEASTIFMILNKIKAVELIDNIKKEIIIVDDCSVDDTGPTIAAYHSQNADLTCANANRITMRSQSASTM